ncbi:putative LOC100569746 [Trichonephila clavipes]|nr:putative LOC100569746 [Trichonephila clavipes]
MCTPSSTIQAAEDYENGAAAMEASCSNQPTKNTEFSQVLNLHLSFALHFMDLVGKGVAINSGPKKPKGHVKEKTPRATIDSLKDTFGDRLISRFGPVNWPPRSCDFTPLDYFLWGYVKSLVYADKPQTLDHLEDNIRRVIADIRPQMLEKVIENWTSRLDYIRASRGSPMPEIIFKM